MKSALLVRSREIWCDPAPNGGAFDRLSLTRFPLPSVVTSPFGTFCVQTTDKVVSLTYDDGPHPDHTPRLLDTLAERAATATFFVLADQVAAHPDIVRRISAEGHEVALHGQDHTALTSLSDAEAIRRVRDARAAVEDTISGPVALFRPPYGMHTWRQGAGIRRLGLDLVIWSGHAWDWIDASVDTVVSRCLAGVFPGAILLLHDHRADPEKLAPGDLLPAFDKAKVLDRVLTEMQEQGFTTVSTSALLDAHQAVRSALPDRMVRK